MKRFLIVLTALILGYLAYDTARYYLGWYIDLQLDAPVSAFMSTDAQHLYMDRGAGPEEFTVKGVNLGVGVPGEWATDYAVSKETYLRWFAQMQEMGANTVRVYITLHDDFYNAFYPIDGVKIDRSIVIESALPRARALLEGMIRLSHDMGIRVLCEGVEDKATCDAVLAAGCDFIQGFYFSRVLPGREAESFLRSLAARDREEG